MQDIAEDSSRMPTPIIAECEHRIAKSARERL
jgi:hypothetical protein